MYDKTSLRLLERIYLSPGIHKRELSRQLKLGMPSIDHAIKKAGNLLKKQKSGNLHRYFLDYSKSSLTPVLHCIEYSRLENLPEKAKIAIREFLKGLDEKPTLSILFGSYATAHYTKESDIDILLVYPKIENGKSIEYTAKQVSLNTLTSLNPIYLDFQDFRKSFHDSTKEFFKSLKREKVLLTGIEWWRQLVDEET